MIAGAGRKRCSLCFANSADGKCIYKCNDREILCKIPALHLTSVATYLALAVKWSKLNPEIRSKTGDATGYITRCVTGGITRDINYPNMSHILPLFSIG